MTNQADRSHIYNVYNDDPSSVRPSTPYFPNDSDSRVFFFRDRPYTKNVSFIELRRAKSLHIQNWRAVTSRGQSYR